CFWPPTIPPTSPAPTSSSTADGSPKATSERAHLCGPREPGPHAGLPGHLGRRGDDEVGTKTRKPLHARNKNAYTKRRAQASWGLSLQRWRLRDALEDAIADGTFPPGERLDEATLAARYAVSRTPIREALMQLAAIGLVVSRPRRGTVVATLTGEQ